MNKIIILASICIFSSTYGYKLSPRRLDTTMIRFVDEQGGDDLDY